ncbi:MAG: YaaA family protein [Tenericutes bacterium]|nr:YaaA family protein [Mycoplasmatota bacterium]
MIILLSPAKTFSKIKVPSENKPLFYKDALLLASKLKKKSLLSIHRKMKISKDLAQNVYDYYQSFSNESLSAIHTYDGYAFKGLDVYSLEQNDLSYMQDHLYILSGLYGLVRPFDGISYYRLEMQDQTLKNLYRFWDKKINIYLKEQHPNELIVNLASHEYSKIIDSTQQVLTISFIQKINGQYKTISMHAKKARGMMARHLIINQTNDKNEIKLITFDGYRYDDTRSDSKTYFFIKELN